LIDRDSEENAIEQIKTCEERMQICVLQKDTFSVVKLEKDILDLSDYPKRSEYLNVLNERFSGSQNVFIGTTGNTAREMGVFMPDTYNFYMAGNMGGALSVALGSYLAGNNTFVCGGDAEFVMHMGGLATAGRYNGKINRQLVYILFDNESNKSTGGQRTYQENIDYIGLVNSNGINVVPYIVKDLRNFEEALNSVNDQNGIYFINVKASYDDEVERPDKVTITQSKNHFLMNK